MRSALAALPLLLSVAAQAVIIDSPDGWANTTAPWPDPGWAHVGRRGALTAVYLGGGVVITANHVGPGTVWLDGSYYAFVPGSAVRLENHDGSPADLLLFAVDPEPPLPDLEIAVAPPALGAPLVMVGNGRNRGDPTAWDANGPPPPGPIEGYAWDPGRSLRWGTNHVESYPATRVLGTEAFASDFDADGSEHECQAAPGDSGGAAFAWTGSGYELAGILYAISEYPGQPAETSLYGQATYSADLSYYRDQIETWRALPEPRGGAALGAALVAALAAARRAPPRPRR